jgi:C_GCAxxG_C_C family probable redox protein
MTRVDSAVENYENGQTCSQAIFVAFCDITGIDRESALKIASGFGSGMRMGETCGAVTGAIMVLGALGSDDDCEKGENRENTYKMVDDFTAQFKTLKKAISCKELLGCDVSTLEGKAQAEEQNLSTTKCPEIVRTAAEIVERIAKSR